MIFPKIMLIINALVCFLSGASSYILLIGLAFKANKEEKDYLNIGIYSIMGVLFTSGCVALLQWASTIGS